MKLKSNSACEAWLGLNKMMGCVIKRHRFAALGFTIKFYSKCNIHEFS